MPDSPNTDIELAEILDRLTCDSVEKRPTLEEITAAYPDLATELRELWGTIMVVDAVAQKTITTASPSQDAPSFPHVVPPPILGDYELLEEIGRGGMGIVYRARQRSLDREIALKLILHGSQASPADQARFQSEVAAIAQLDHSHIVPIYEVGEEHGWHFFGMKLIDGGNLSQIMAAGPLPERRAADITLKISRAIACAHASGIIHRDLKPANILIDKTGEPHISDFGLAKHVSSGSSLTQTGTILGTPSYMAPEQAAGNRFNQGPSCDVYGLGAILYALLTGRPPFQGSSPVDTVMMVLEQDPLPPRLLNQGVSRDLEMIVLRSMQKSSELRYQSAHALADDLQAYLSGESISARSGHLKDVVARLFRETHHAIVLENWGVLWMWHAAVLLSLCLVTNWLRLQSDRWPSMMEHWPYLILWGGGLILWAPIFWALRHRSGPVTVVERQIAHAWGGSIVAVILLFVIELLLEFPVLFLSPILGLIGGMVFVVKAGILAGSFYVHAFALFAVAVIMAGLQSAGWPYGITLFGVVSAATFFLPGCKYYLQNRANAVSGEKEAGSSFPYFDNSPSFERQQHDP
ncbi:MAG: protein kinase [Planctomycetaceae bacterium]|nr:protein kinase [Planctomycetaceae bacterium]